MTAQAHFPPTLAALGDTHASDHDTAENSLLN